MIELKPHAPEHKHDGCGGYGDGPIDPEAGFEDCGWARCCPIEEGHGEECLGGVN
jgi:hypothetical protein